MKMAKIPKWLIDKKELKKEDMDKFCCRHGSFTCGLLTKLYPIDITKRCRLCRKENLKPQGSGKSQDVKFIERHLIKQEVNRRVRESDN